MSGFRDKHLSVEIERLFIKNSVTQAQMYLLALMVLCVFIHICYLYFYSSSLNNQLYYSWIITAIATFALAFLVNLFHFKRQNHKLYLFNHWLKAICMLSGSILGLGIALFHLNYLKLNGTESAFDNLIMSSLLFIIGSSLCLIYLTHRSSYFFWTILPLSLPLLLVQLLTFEPSIDLFFVVYDFAVIILILCGWTTIQNKERIHQLFYKNYDLKRTAETHLKTTEALYDQLKNEMQHVKEIEAALQLNNQLLEQKVKERTSALRNINLRLEANTQNLKLAHDIAGIYTWRWDIAKRQFKMDMRKELIIGRNSIKRLEKLEALIHPDDLVLAKQALKQHLRGLSERFEVVIRVRSKHEQEWKWVQELGQVVKRDPQNKIAKLMVGMSRDISQERKDQDRLRLAASVLEQAAEGIFILDQKLCYVDVNPCFEQITSLSRQEILGKYVFDLLRSDDLQQKELHFKIKQEILTYGKFGGELNEMFISGRKPYIWLHINAVKDTSNRIMSYVGIVSDNTQRKRQEQRLSYLENYNALTNLPNRLYYINQLHHYLTNQKKSIKKLAIIRINIDRFRVLNEYLTQQGGNELLRQVSNRLRLATREALLLAYLNADDFVVVYDISALSASIEQISNHILKQFLAPFYVQKQELRINLSMGIVCYPDHGRQIESLNSRAEQALSDAKRLGGDTVCYYAPERYALTMQGVNIERELRQAILKKELVVHYQAKICTISKKVIGFEALVRWQHPTRGLIYPNDFIPIAQETSLISEIGYFVMMQTAQQIRQWIDLGFKEISVSINIVAQQIHRGELVKDLDKALECYNLNGELLELELSESSLIENSATVKKVLEAVKGRGVKISLDDFGTGYSALVYLTEYPIDTLKIDQSFVAQIGHARQEAIVNAVIAMGKAMNMTLVAEGVESLEQAHYLKQKNCDILQGFLFSKPLDAKESTLLLQNPEQLRNICF